MLALAGIGTRNPRVRAAAGNNFSVLFGCHFFMVQM
jgi:hypothetical protein